MKPLGHKSYGSIAHLPGSRLGPGDHKCHEGQERICLEKLRDKHDRVIVQEKLDGSNVGVARIDGRIVALSRAGYEASTSPYIQHHAFGWWVAANQARFLNVLEDGERICGEWLLQAHGTRYAIRSEPFVAFDIMRGQTRTPWLELVDRIGGAFVLPETISIGPPVSISDAMAELGEYGRHGAIDPIEGAMWRVERNEQIPGTQDRKWRVDFLAKYVRPDKADGTYLGSVTGGSDLINGLAKVA